MALYGDAMLGWGLSPSNITSPGPLINATEGDVVSLSLYSTDGIPHRFYIDYNDNGFLDDTEPSSQDFTSSVTPVLFEFTVTMTGNFTYRCFYHPTVMYGPFSINIIPEFSPAVLLTAFAGTTMIALSLLRRRIPSRART